VADEFGWSVAVNNDTAVVGAINAKVGGNFQQGKRTSSSAIAGARTTGARLNVWWPQMVRPSMISEFESLSVAAP
jgi:hypothetical protein